MDASKWATCKTWTQTLNNLDPQKTWTLKNRNMKNFENIYQKTVECRKKIRTVA